MIGGTGQEFDQTHGPPADHSLRTRNRQPCGALAPPFAPPICAAIAVSPHHQAKWVKPAGRHVSRFPHVSRFLLSPSAAFLRQLSRDRRRSPGGRHPWISRAVWEAPLQLSFCGLLRQLSRPPRTSRRVAPFPVRRSAVLVPWAPGPAAPASSPQYAVRTGHRQNVQRLRRLSGSAGRSCTFQSAHSSAVGVLSSTPRVYQNPLSFRFREP